MPMLELTDEEIEFIQQRRIDEQEELIRILKQEGCKDHHWNVEMVRGSAIVWTCRKCGEEQWER